MKTCVCCISAWFVLVAATPSWAQDAPTAAVMATYYRCAQGGAAQADAIFKEHFAPFLKAEQAAGRIAAYGWAEHIEGGAWRRLLYVTGTDIGKMSDSRGAMVAMAQSPEHVKAFEEFGKLCPSHDDYIWRSKSSSQAAGDVGRVRSPFAMSTYYECDSNEVEADAIFATSFAPVLNQRVKDGTIASWNWLSHLFGGEYRRALVIDGKDEKALLSNWASLQDDLEKAAPDLARRFDQICHSHADYIWRASSN
jgi:hypothetical protein